MGRVLPIVLLCGLVFRLSVGCRYETIGRRHTMCIYEEDACPTGQLLRNGLSQDDKDLIVRVHNRLRSKVALGRVQGLPAAADMRVMSWDDELATIAQRWADQCTTNHDQLRNIQRGQVGQNLAYSGTSGAKDPKLGDKPDWSLALNMWEEEYDEYGFSSRNISPFVFNSDVGHYTQMIWAGTHKIGCGYAFYKEPSRKYKKLYVCNYFPAGNMIQGTMYKVSSRGATCTDPSLELSSENRGLCGKRRSTNNQRPENSRRTFWRPRHEYSRFFRLHKRNADRIKRNPYNSNF